MAGFFPEDYNPESVPLDDTLTSNSFFITNPTDMEYTSLCKYYADLAEQYAGEASDSADLAEYWALYAENIATNFEVVTDTSPQLGGDLDVNGFGITAISGVNIPITTVGTANILLDGIAWPKDFGLSTQVLTTDGSGISYWSTVSSGGGGGATDFIISADTQNIVTTEGINGISSQTDDAFTVTTVNGVVLDAIRFPTLDGTAGQVLETNGAGLLAWTSPATGDVNSVFTRSGAVVAEVGDYLASQVTNDSAVVGNYVSSALTTLDSGKLNNVVGTTNNFTMILASGQISDSGFTDSDFALVVHDHVKADITDFSDADYATAAQGLLADTAIQPTDSVGDLSDVDLTGIVLDDGLKWDGAKFIAGSVQANLIEIGGYTEAITTLPAIDASLYNFYKATQTNNITFTITGVPNGAYTCQFEIHSDGVGTLTWPVGVDWVPGSPPPIISAGEVYQVTLTTTDNGTNWTGSHNIGDSSFDSPLTGKGDLYTYSTENTRLAVGADGLALVADSSQATGMKWAVPAAPAPVDSVFTRTGAVVAEAGDYAAFYATVAQGALADTALQVGDNVSQLVNDAQYFADGDILDGGTY